LPGDGAHGAIDIGARADTGRIVRWSGNDEIVMHHPPAFDQVSGPDVLDFGCRRVNQKDVSIPAGSHGEGGSAAYGNHLDANSALLLEGRYDGVEQAGIVGSGRGGENQHGLLCPDSGSQRKQQRQRKQQELVPFHRMKIAIHRGRVHMRAMSLLLLVPFLSNVAMAQNDSAFRELQARGKVAMGVDQYTSAHRFEQLPNGGRIELQREVDDSAGVAQIRKHLQEIAVAFRNGDFRIPGMVHAMAVPGTDVMAARRESIRYEFAPLPRGGEVRLVTSDPAATRAIHEFLAFQNQDHRTDEGHQH
jgi:hypothetical protein